ncbi:bile acid:sodium symporter family protein [Acetobacter orleanensis]|uniref:Bile acid:sodium symporter n=1 Tax=Acetobacter orleanensis TaxID=104099 RepID=A0A4Y3TJQ8_9PROT|nr:bile acid:sodium symporter family protein [Acetobacter orleanensis]KXV62027.1 bile acid:sodium symporter [Acetobacter orleanensis]PCD80361.1 bile acid:sodium symporter [Acetobacter orleanensis]GAN68883.1 bile acid/Na+ symporter [Acetobacter orleanensis JCM 7639]GBR30853.1 bile acid/Na+ symporter [Acetobacter orleanensis NRIC 0473]GEB81709.1 bile acid:sodium symporter [Acetobacter orleanensis]
MLKLDPFLIGLTVTIILATVLPCHGAAVPVFHWLTIIVIAVMFFLQGARLSRKAVVDGVMAWRLHLIILTCTFVMFPLLGLAAHALMPGLLENDIWVGMLFLCCLPSTVQSSIAFTSIGGGNVPAAVCAATASNIAGIFITPFLVGLVLSKHGGTSGNVLDIVFQLLLPFVLGQLLQPWIGRWAHRNKKLLSLTDRGSVLIVVYTAFSEAVMQGLWHRLPLSQLGMIALVDFLLLVCVLLITTYGSRLAGVPLRDEIAIVFCGSKKTLASGVPMANVLFPAASVGLIVLPLMIYHQIQLFVCAVLARKFARMTQENAEGLPAVGVPQKE